MQCYDSWQNRFQNFKIRETGQKREFLVVHDSVSLRSKCYCLITKNSGATESLAGIVLKPRGNRFSNDRSAIRAVECAAEVAVDPMKLLDQT